MRLRKEEEEDDERFRREKENGDLRIEGKKRLRIFLFLGYVFLFVKNTFFNYIY